MTEAEWVGCTDPQKMLKFLRGKVTDRKLRLFAVACCRRGRSILRSRTTLAALDALEAYADGLITRKAMDERRTAWYQRFDYPFPISGTWNSALAQATITHTKVWAGEAAEQAARASKRPEKEQHLQARFLHDIFGDPFHPLAVEPSWLAWNDGIVLKIAQNIYDERAFDSLPILADALDDAGCDNVDILEHCRQPGPHVRGCWVVDLLTGRS
jgi:hypothetical protein